MKNKISNVKKPDKKVAFRKKDNSQGYPLYPANEDIFNNSKEEIEIDPEDISKSKNTASLCEANSEEDFICDVSGDDLDFPDSELDDVQKNAGIEDEENSLYSLGGDDHNDLDEYKNDLDEYQGE